MGKETEKRTYHLSRPAIARLNKLAAQTGLKFSTIIERLILGLPVGTREK
jgi:hypothetical protein